MDKKNSKMESEMRSLVMRRGGIVIIRGDKLAKDIRDQIVETDKMLFGAVPGEGEGSHQQHGRVG